MAKKVWTKVQNIITGTQGEARLGGRKLNNIHDVVRIRCKRKTIREGCRYYYTYWDSACLKMAK